MKYYGIEMIGNFTCQKYTTLSLAGSAGNEGRLIYVEDVESLYIDDGEEWLRASKSSFITLTDCPSAYVADNLPIVNPSASGIIFTPISASVMISNLSAGITEATSASMNTLIVVPASASLTATDAVLSASIISLESSLSASTITRSITGGIDRKIPVWDGNGRYMVTAHTSAYITSAGDLYASKVYNAVWNDIADFIEVDCDIDYGYVYVMDENQKIRKSENYCELGIIGLATDTYGFGLGNHEGKKNMMPISIGGFVLAHIDKIYIPGTPLTSGPNGKLTELYIADKQLFPERIVAIFLKTENNKTWNDIEVNGRHWVKVI